MAKYLIKASYSVEGLKGLMKVGGTHRVRTMERADNGFVMGPSIFILFVWDLIQNNGSLSYLLTEPARAALRWLTF